MLEILLIAKLKGEKRKLLFDYKSKTNMFSNKKSHIRIMKFLKSFEMRLAQLNSVEWKKIITNIVAKCRFYYIVNKFCI